MNVPELLEAVQDAGGSLVLMGERIQYALPDFAVWLVPELKQNRDELIGLLREGRTPPPMPPGVRLLKWEVKDPPRGRAHGNRQPCGQIYRRDGSAAPGKARRQRLSRGELVSARARRSLGASWSGRKRRKHAV